MVSLDEETVLFPEIAAFIWVGTEKREPKLEKYEKYEIAASFSDVSQSVEHGTLK